MSLPEYPQELSIDQSHLGVLLLAGLVALAATCLAASLALALLFQVARWRGYTLCLFVPVFGLVMLVGFSVLRWGERFLVQLWPSGRRLVLDREALALKQHGRVSRQICWDRPFEMLCWRVRRVHAMRDPALPPAQLCLACQLRQEDDVISLYTGASVQEWRRVPGWKQFALLQQPARPGQWQPALNVRGPAHRGASSLPEADPALVWPAERHRRRSGLALSLQDFSSVIEAAGFVE